MENTTLILALSPVILLTFILAISVIVSIFRKPIPWSEKWYWLLLIFVTTIGPIIYFVFVSRFLDEKAANYITEESNQ